MNSKSKVMELNADLEKSQTNVNETHNNDYGKLTDIQQIEGTPFTAVKAGDLYFLALGKYRLSEPMPSMEHVKEDAKRADWERLLQVIGVTIEEYNKQPINI